MKKSLGVAFFFLILVKNLALADNPLPLPQANVLPLELSDQFEFRKFDIFINAQLRPRSTPMTTRELMIYMERHRRTWGATDNNEINAKTGEFFTFFWRAKRQADLTLRFEYRQSNLKNLVQAREIYYQAARGSHESAFDIVGNDYSEDGRVTSWRALLIENQKIVALLQSRAWR
ncbi:MAG: hypothetical protein JOZ08_21085 [Verrucomicrobia bacterium]|nr:hypothetical protein [Verrucomicrobiota bacterium]